MKSTGNGRPEQCSVNLLAITRGEVPYERLKGLETKLIDQPSSTVAPEVRVDMEWGLRIYEPRVIINRMDLVSLLSKEGQFGVDTDIATS